MMMMMMIMMVTRVLTVTCNAAAGIVENTAVARVIVRHINCHIRLVRTRSVDTVSNA